MNLPNLRFAFRTLVRQRTFALSSILCLALGLGANASIFSVVSSFLFMRLPVEDAERVALIWSTNLSRGWDRQVTSAPDFADWAARSRSFQQMAAFRSAAHNLSGGRIPTRVSASHVSDAFFDVLGVQPALGRGFRPQDDAPGAESTVLLSHALWQSAFGGNPGVLGQEVELDGRRSVVIGVMPAGFWFADPGVQLWRPLGLDPPREERGQRSLIVIGRLASGISMNQAQAEMGDLAGSLEQQYPETNQGWGVRAVALPDQLVQQSAPAVAMLFGAVSLVLLIACANVGNLLLARAAARKREVALRQALGAGRLRIVRQLLAECLLLALAGGAAGLLLAYWGIEVLRGMVGQVSPWLAEGITLNANVLGYLLAVTLITPLVFGLAPAIQGSRLNLVDSLKAGRQSSAAGPRRRLRSSLAVAEMALALVLLVTAGLFVRTLAALERIELGFDPQGVLVLQMSASLPDQSGGEAPEFFRRVLQRIEALPGVESAGAASSVPTAGSRFNPTRAVTIEGRASDSQEVQPLVQELVAAPGYFRALKIPLLAGRPLSESDSAEAPAAALVSRALAERFWPAEDPLGRLFKFGAPETAASWIEVVGVVEDVINDDRDQPPLPLVYRPLAQSPLGELYVVARTTVSDPLDLAAAVRRQVWAEDPDQPVYNLRTLNSLLEEDLSGSYLIIRILSALALAALSLAVMGIYGLMAYLAQRQRREVGIRLALGASRGRIMRQVAGQGMALALIGAALGLAGSMGVAKLASGMLYGISSFDPITFGAASLLLLAVSLLASSIPAWKASRSDPIKVLRCP